MRLDPGRFFSDIHFDRRRSIVAAVSGGSDSLALLFLLKVFLDRDHPGTRLVAATVDHGLRDGSAAEAQMVADLCKSLGVEHRIEAWDAAKPKTGLSAAAREARYDLLARSAVACGADLVFTGHTMDDQAETVAMRAQRSTGGGLAGMARETLFDGRVWIVRPLLGARRQELREHLAGLGVRWVDDPSNENAAYERVRVRARLSDAEVERLTAEARQAGVARAALAREAAALFGRFASRPALGLFRLDPAMFGTVAADRGAAAVHALRILLAVAGGTPHLPDIERTQALAERLGGEALRATLSRAVVDARKNGIWIRREARGLPSIAIGDREVLWDGRYRISGPAMTVAPLSEARAREANIEAFAAPESLIRAALAVEPAFFAETGVVSSAPPGIACKPVATPWARFLPGFDIEAASAVLQLLGAPPLPSPPSNKHIAAGA